MAQDENAALRQRFELLKGAENHKNALIEVYLPQRMFEPSSLLQKGASASP